MTPYASSSDMYWDWHSKLEEDKKTSLGVKINREYIGNSIVSTVFLGRPVGPSKDGPLLFETLVAGGKYHRWMRRHASHGASLAGAEEMIKRIKADQYVEQLDEALLRDDG
jgi:hypothetical protein